MDEREIARRASILPDRFVGRIPAETLASLRLISGGGEYGELVLELAATLAVRAIAIGPAEQYELRFLLDATGKPADLADQIPVQP